MRFVVGIMSRRAAKKSGVKMGKKKSSEVKDKNDVLRQSSSSVSL